MALDVNDSGFESGDDGDREIDSGVETIVTTTEVDDNDDDEEQKDWEDRCRAVVLSIS